MRRIYLDYNASTRKVYAPKGVGALYVPPASWLAILRFGEERRLSR